MNNRKLLNIELGRVTPEQYKALPESGINIVLDNIRSAHNVGSVFRSGDSFKADKIWLCGICATPPSAEIHKSALGAEFSVEWEYAPDTLEVVKRLHEDDARRDGDVKRMFCPVLRNLQDSVGSVRAVLRENGNPLADT